MKPTLVALSVLVPFALLLPVAAAAQVGQSEAVVSLFPIAHDSFWFRECAHPFQWPACQDFPTERPVHAGTYVYLIVATTNSGLGISGVSCGISYSTPGTKADGIGCDVLDFTLCADMEYPASPDGDPAHAWPASGGGNRFIWDRTTNCQDYDYRSRGVRAVAGFFYVYAYGPDQFQVTRNNCVNPPEFQVLDCAGPSIWNLNYPSAAAVLGFGSPGYNPCQAGGGTSFYPVSASGEGGSSTVTVRFSANPAGGSTDPSNYHVYPTGFPSQELGTAAVSVSGPAATLTLGSVLAGTVRYTVEVDHIEDESGTPIAPHAAVEFIAGGQDTSPPLLVSASGVPNTNRVSVEFSENVYAGADVASNYTVYPSADPSSPLAVTYITRSYNLAMLTLGRNLEEFTAYTVAVSNVQDMNGIPIAPNSTVTFTASLGDVTPPALTGATGEAGHGTVRLTFSENLGVGANKTSNYAVYPAADPGSPLAVIYASASGNQATLSLGTSLAATTTYTVSVSNIRDVTGNVIVPNSTMDFVTGAGDATAPVLANAIGVTGSDNVTLRFSEPVAGGATTIANYSVYPTSEPSSTFGIRAVIVAASQVTLRLESALTGATSYTVVVSNVADAAGNVIAAHSTATFTTDVAGGGPGDQSQAVVAVHVQAHDSKAFNCASMDAGLSCDRFVREWPVGSPADVFMVICMADPVFGVSGVSLGVRYAESGTLADGMGCDVHGYVSCADLEYPNSPDGSVAHEFPYSGGGNRLIWDRTTNCQRQTVEPWGVQVVACAFYVYAYGPDLFQVDMNRNLETGPEFQIVDCPGPFLSDMPWPEHAGSVGFGQSRSGYSPCTAMVPTVHTTWGRLKNQYH
jgi:hypothetical protein